VGSNGDSGGSKVGEFWEESMGRLAGWRWRGSGRNSRAVGGRQPQSHGVEGIEDPGTTALRWLGVQVAPQPWIPRLEFPGPQTLPSQG
jgi:hypothetical protein